MLINTVDSPHARNDYLLWVGCHAHFPSSGMGVSGWPSKHAHSGGPEVGVAPGTRQTL
jgi:hypothetical protein